MKTPDVVMMQLGAFEREQQAEQDTESRRDIVIDEVYSMTVEDLLRKLQREARGFHQTDDEVQIEKQFAYLITDVVDLFTARADLND